VYVKNKATKTLRCVAFFNINRRRQQQYEKFYQLFPLFELFEVFVNDIECTLYSVQGLLVFGGCFQVIDRQIERKIIFDTIRNVFI